MEKPDLTPIETKIRGRRWVRTYYSIYGWMTVVTDSGSSEVVESVSGDKQAAILDHMAAISKYRLPG